MWIFHSGESDRRQDFCRLKCEAETGYRGEGEAVVKGGSGKDSGGEFFVVIVVCCWIVFTLLVQCVQQC